MKEKLVVLFAANLIDKSIVRFLEKEFEVSVVDMSTEKVRKPNEQEVDLLKTVNLIIFTGGEDVDPEKYMEQAGKYTYSNKKRDNDEFEYLYPVSTKNYFLTKLPKLGICRGAQFLTVYNGGSLIQHVEGHKNNDQVIENVQGQNYVIASDHHQMMNPFWMKKDNYELIAWSKNFQSDKYLNGKNENIVLPKGFLEPEIVYYKNSNSLCIQAHPEWCIDTPGSNYCLRLISKYLFKREIIGQKNNEDVVDYSLPPGMNKIPHGWIRSGNDGRSYVFDGESFVLSNSYISTFGSGNIKKKSSQSTLNSIQINHNDLYNYIDYHQYSSSTAQPNPLSDITEF